MSHRVVLIPGDGIGPEVTDAARRALDASGASIEWVVEEAGSELAERTGVALPQRTLEAIRECGVALKGPITTRADAGGPSVNIALRRELDLYVGIRPCRTFTGVPRAAPGVDVVVIRMNGEDLYAGIGYGKDDPRAHSLRDFIRTSNGAELSTDTAISVRPLSLSGARRVARHAFEYALANDRRRVTAVHKATVIRDTDGLFLAAARAEAGEHPGVELDDVLIDTCVANLVRHPDDYDVLLLPVVYGDIVSDLCAALVGGPGLAPGANIGPACAVFEAAHGSVPKYRGMQRANPLAVVLAGVMLLRHLGEVDAAGRVEGAVAALLGEGTAMPRDLCSSDAEAVTTGAVAQALVGELSR
jgi:isocitrate dehydrogenase (NAD+)